MSNNIPVFHRVVILFIVCCIFLGLSVPFASAATVGSLDNSDGSLWFDILPFIDSGATKYYDSTDRLMITFSSAPKSNYSYIDILFYTDSTSFGISTNANWLNIYKISGDLYRATGPLFIDSVNNYAPYFYLHPSDGSYVNFISCKVSLYYDKVYNLPFYYQVCHSYHNSGVLSKGASDGSVFYDLDNGFPSDFSNGFMSFYIFLSVSLENQRKYDYLDFTLSLSCSDIYSIRASQGDKVIDVSYNFINPDGGGSISNRTRYIQLTVDLSSIDRTSSDQVSIYLDGEFYTGRSDSGYVYFNHCFGSLQVDTNSIQYWIAAQTASMKTWFSETFSWLSDILDELKILNGDDSDAVTAIQTQEEINVSVNNQLVGAVEDWNTNIEVVQTGYDSAVTKATPALAWLASLADGVFSGMGWFGNIYFLIGLISVIMLVLSKSGLARSVSRFRRSD